MNRRRLFALIVCIGWLLTGCRTSFNREQCIEKLQKFGFLATLACTTEQELAEATDYFNQDILVRGGNFTVEILDFINLRKAKGAEFPSCQFITFSNAEQAEQYYNLLIESRSEFYEVSLQDNLIVFTNSQDAIDLLNIEFE